MNKHYNCFILTVKIIIKIAKIIIIRICRNQDIIPLIVDIIYRQVKIKNGIELIKYFIKVFKISYFVLNIIYSSILGRFLKPINNIYKNGTYTLKNGIFLKERYEYIISYIILYILDIACYIIIYNNYKCLFIIAQIMIIILLVILTALDDIYCFKNKILNKFYQWYLLNIFS